MEENIKTHENKNGTPTMGGFGRECTDEELGGARIVLAAPCVIGIICIIRADFRRTKL